MTGRTPGPPPVTAEKARWKIYSPLHIQRPPDVLDNPPTVDSDVSRRTVLENKLPIYTWHKPDIPHEFQGFSRNLYSHLPYWADSDGGIP